MGSGRRGGRRSVAGAARLAVVAGIVAGVPDAGGDGRAWRPCRSRPRASSRGARRGIGPTSPIASLHLGLPRGLDHQSAGSGRRPVPCGATSRGPACAARRGPGARPVVAAGQSRYRPHDLTGHRRPGVPSAGRRPGPSGRRPAGRRTPAPPRSPSGSRPGRPRPGPCRSGRDDGRAGTVAGCRPLVPTAWHPPATAHARRNERARTATLGPLPRTCPIRPPGRPGVQCRVARAAGHSLALDRSPVVGSRQRRGQGRVVSRPARRGERRR